MAPPLRLCRWRIPKVSPTWSDTRFDRIEAPCHRRPSRDTGLELSQATKRACSTPNFFSSCGLRHPCDASAHRYHRLSGGWSQGRGSEWAGMRSGRPGRPLHGCRVTPVAMHRPVGMAAKGARVRNPLVRSPLRSGCANATIAPFPRPWTDEICLFRLGVRTDIEAAPVSDGASGRTGSVMIADGVSGPC